jgi:hypothetical protein
MELEIPQPRIARRSSRTKMGHFVGDVGHDGFAHFLATCRTGMAGLPPFSASFDVATSFCSARQAFRFRSSRQPAPTIRRNGSTRRSPASDWMPRT